MNKTIQLKYIAPVLLSFFVMSFCDMVGITVDRVKSPDIFHLGDFMIQLIPSVVFVWFFILSIPVGVLQDRFGKRNILNVGMFITAVGLFIPFFIFTEVTLFIGFALLGIGNTIVQVSANPLLVDVVPDEKNSSFLSLSQFIKAIGSMLAPYIAAYFANQFGNWKLMFLTFGIVSVLSIIWLQFTKIEETKNTGKQATIGSTLGLLKNNFIALMVLGIFLVVGIDVGINAVSGQFLIAKFNIESSHAEKARSIYFFGRMLGTFLGAALLVKLSSRKFFIWTTILSLFAMVAFLFSPSATFAMVIIFIIGLGVANIFPLIFSLAVEQYPLRANEISGLMIMAVCGGAVIPPLFGYLKQNAGVTAGMLIFVACTIYELLLALMNKKTKN